MAMDIRRVPPDDPDAAALVAELEAHLASRYPAASRHGFSVERLVAAGVHFFLLHADGEPAACGGLLLVPDEDGGYAEIKRMYTRPARRGAGLGRRLLAHLVAHGHEEGYARIRLETGVDQVEAIALYESAGFRPRPPFGPYREDPLSRCYELHEEESPDGSEDPEPHGQG